MTLPKPLFVGIAGGTGSGKSTIARKIAGGIPEGSVSVIDHDAYYRDHSDLPFDQRQDLNYDHPDSLENALLAEHLDQLRQGRPTHIPIYDFVTHSRCSEQRLVMPTPVIIVEGILVFVDAELRQRLDVKIFVDTDSDIRLFRRIRRDMQDRGRSFQQIRDQYYRTVRPMHIEYVEPSKRWADLIIPEGGNNQVALDVVLSKLLTVVSQQAAAPTSHSPESRAPYRPRAGSPAQRGTADQMPPPPQD